MSIHPHSLGAPPPPSVFSPSLCLLCTVHRNDFHSYWINEVLLNWEKARAVSPYTQTHTLTHCADSTVAHMAQTTLSQIQFGCFALLKIRYGKLQLRETLVKLINIIYTEDILQSQHMKITHKCVVSWVRPGVGPCHHGNTVLRVENTTELWDLRTVVKHPNLCTSSVVHINVCTGSIYCTSVSASRHNLPILAFPCVQTQSFEWDTESSFILSLWGTCEGPHGPKNI